MIFLSKYQDNQTAEPVKIMTSPFRNPDRTCILIEEVFTREKSIKNKNLYLLTRGQYTGSNIFYNAYLYLYD